MVLFSVILLGIIVSSERTGIKFGISNASINTGKTELLRRLISESQERSLVNSTSLSGRQLFSYTLTLEDLRLRSIDGDIENSELVFIPTNRMNLTFLNFTGALDTSFSLSYSFIKLAGQASLEIRGLNLSANLHVYETKGHPVMEIEELVLEISEFELKVSESRVSRIINWVFRLLSNRITKRIKTEISSTLKDAMNDVLFNIFTTNRLVRLVDDKIGVNYTLTDNVNISKEFIEIPSAGEFFLLGSCDRPDLQEPQELPEFSTELGGIQAAVSDYMINTAFYAAFKAGEMRTTLKAGMFPSLNTRSLKKVFPRIEEVFGKKKECEAVCYVADNPPFTQIDVENSSVVGILEAKCDLNVKDVGVASKFSMILEIDALPYLEKWTLKGNLIVMNAANVQEFENFTGEGVLNEELQVFVNELIQGNLPFFSTLVFGDGIALPQNGSDNLEDFKLKVVKGYLIAAAKPIY